MRKLIATLAVVALPAAGFAAAGASAADPPVTKAATKTVQLGDNFFKPKSLKVKKGTILRFVWGPGNEGTAVEHNVTGIRGNKFTNGEDTTRPDKPFRKRITRTTTIVCTIHSTTMKMKVTVRK
jgi:plastocyanin